MTFQKMMNDFEMDMLSMQQMYDAVQKKENLRKINYYAHRVDVNKEPLIDSELQELNSIVNVLQTLYTSPLGSPISDSTYDVLQEILVDMGIPRLTGAVEINDAKKASHRFKNLRGTLDKVYYLTTSETRSNSSRKYLDEWISSITKLYEQATGKRIDFNQVKVMCQPKFDGVSAILEWDGKHAVWLSRGDTSRNRASDISHIMNVFNDVYCAGDEPYGIKFEVMVSEENKNHINELYRKRQYRNSRQVVISTLNSSEPDFKVDYLYPVPLRITKPGEQVEDIHPTLIEKFPTMICTLGEREKIKEYANSVRWVPLNNTRLRTDGIVITILDRDIQKVLGRENDINRFEIAYKFTEEVAYTRVKGMEFYVSEFGYITPVLVVNDVILKGNTINHISLSNKERFDELGLAYGDMVKVLYDIIPYVVVDDVCKRQKYSHKIDFVTRCPRCGQLLDLDATEVQCKNPVCPSRIIGRIMNYCSCLRIKNIGYSTIEALYNNDLLKNGIRSLYKLHKKRDKIEHLEGFGKLKARKIVAEIEAKRRLRDYEFFGALGIEGLSTKTFQGILSQIKLEDFVNMILLRNFDLLYAKLVEINGIGGSKAEQLVSFFKDTKNRVDFQKLYEEVRLSQSYRDKPDTQTKGRIVFTGCRPDDELINTLIQAGYEPSDSWSNSARYLIIPHQGYESSKVAKALGKGIPLIPIDQISTIEGVKI